MSQVPPIPQRFPAHAPQQPTPGYPTPPPAQYPTHAYPPNQAYALQPARGNAAAVVSLISGLLLCVPFLTGLIAVITGLVGAKNARQPGRSGGAVAMIGLILGLVNVVCWGAATPKMITIARSAYGQVTAQNEVARQFLRDLSSGDVNAAAAKCHTTMPREALDQAAKTVAPWGAFQEASVNSVNVQKSTDAGESWLIEGTAKYATGDRKFRVEFGKENGNWVIVEYNLKP